MSLQLHAPAASAPSQSSVSAFGGFRESVPRLLMIVVSGPLALQGTYVFSVHRLDKAQQQGTSSAELSQLWGEFYVPNVNSTASGPRWQIPAALDTGDEGSAEIARRAVSELRRISGLTWDQLGELFGVTRRSVHFWASGQPLNAVHEEHLLRVLDVMREADRGDARATRAALFEGSGGIVPFALLATKQFDEARTLLGKGIGRRVVGRTDLSSAARTARGPLLPDELVDAMHEPVHRTVGRSRAVRTIRSKKPRK